MVITEADRFYLMKDKSPCCAGCDHWEFYNSVVGECTKGAPVSSSDRLSMIGFESASINIAGHILTTREHHCGDFIDSFDWSAIVK